MAILTYHALVGRPAELEAWPPGARLYVFTLEEFCRQLDHLAGEGLEAVSMAHFVRWHQGEAELPPRPVVLAFDDGHRSNAELALPALQARGQRAIFFVTAGRVGREGCVTWDQLGGMLEAGMEVGSHTLTHPQPSRLGRPALRHELVESKRVLEDGLGREVAFVASPTGYDSRRFGALAHEAGYRAALQGVIGRNRRSTDLFALRRFVLKRSYGFETFRRLVEPRSKAHVPMRVRQAARNVVRHVLGPRGYEAIRRRLLAEDASSKHQAPGDKQAPSAEGQ
ncbi:MAG: polysaccharide deacetylase family protein [Candidatus Brocadiia bacterium]